MKFPNKKYLKFNDFFKNYILELKKVYSSLDLESINKISNILEKVYISKKKLFICGNGGSASLAEHFVADHMKILGSTNKYNPKIVSLCSNKSLITAIANDINYESIFENQLKYLSEKGDYLLVISCSGNSPNVINALNWANKNKLNTISFTGFDGGKAKRISKYNIHCNSNNYGVIEDIHQSLMHIVCQFLRNKVLTKKKIIKTYF